MCSCRPSKSQQALDLATWFLLSPHFKFGFQLMIGIWYGYSTFLQ